MLAAESAVRSVHRFLRREAADVVFEAVSNANSSDAAIEFGWSRHAQPVNDRRGPTRSLKSLARRAIELTRDAASIRLNCLSRGASTQIRQVMHT